MTRFTPKDVEGFKSWLHKHRVRDISIDDGIPKKAITGLSQYKTKRR